MTLVQVPMLTVAQNVIPCRILHSIKLSGLRATSSGSIRAIEPGMGISLKHGQHLVLDDPDTARIMHVGMQALR